MSAAEVERIAARLLELADLLGSPDLSDEDAEALAREAADLAARGGAALEAEIRDLGAREDAEGET